MREAWMRFEEQLQQADSEVEERPLGGETAAVSRRRAPIRPFLALIPGRSACRRRDPRACGRRTPAIGDARSAAG